MLAAMVSVLGPLVSEVIEAYLRDAWLAQSVGGTAGCQEQLQKECLAKCLTRMSVALRELAA